MMAANISDGKLLCVFKLIPTDENVILSDYLQLLLSSPTTLFWELIKIIKPSSLIIISAKEINSGEQGNWTFCKPHNLVSRVLLLPSPGARERERKERTPRTRLQPTRLLNEFHIILQFVTAVTCGSFLGTQLQQNNTPAVSTKAKPKRFQFIISVCIFHVNLFPTSLIISPKLEISRNLSGRKEAKG